MWWVEELRKSERLVMYGANERATRTPALKHLGFASRLSSYRRRFSAYVGRLGILDVCKMFNHCGFVHPNPMHSSSSRNLSFGEKFAQCPITSFIFSTPLPLKHKEHKWKPLMGQLTSSVSDLSVAFLRPRQLELSPTALKIKQCSFDVSCHREMSSKVLRFAVLPSGRTRR